MNRILIIDDDPVFVKVCESLLTSAGYVVDAAEGGERGMEMVRKHTPDLILLDLHMRKMSGVRVLKMIRSRAATQDTPVIAFSGAATSRLVTGVWDAGANRFVAKDDFDPDEFLDAVRSTLANRRERIVLPDVPRSQPSPEPATPAKPAPQTPEARQFEIEQFRAFRAELRQALLHGAPAMLQRLRTHSDQLTRAEDPATRAQALLNLRQAIGEFPQTAQTIGFQRIEQISRLLDALLEELQESLQQPPSAQHTIDQAVEFLSFLTEEAAVPEVERFQSGMALVVDDDSTSRWVVSSALELANLKAVRADDSRVALRLLEENSFDLILLDLHMPGMNGLELCAAIRALPLSQATPILIVTGHDDFENRARSALEGSADFVAKPFLLGELAIKAAIHVTEARMKRAKRPSDS